jgi:2-phosphoglycerate kinase
VSRSTNIFIYGAPGAGKTTLSIALKKELHYLLIEGDYLREAMAQKEKTITEDPFVYLGTSEAWRKFGPLTEENVIKGLWAVRKSMAPYVEREISKYSDDFILEAAFLDPYLVEIKGQLMLVVTSDAKEHERQYFEHRDRDENHKETFQAVRMIQDYLLKEVISYSVRVIENGKDIYVNADRGSA